MPTREEYLEYRRREREYAILVIFLDEHWEELAKTGGDVWELCLDYKTRLTAHYQQEWPDYTWDDIVALCRHDLDAAKRSITLEF